MVFTKCMVGWWTYHLRSLAFDPSCLQRIDNYTRARVLPALTMAMRCLRIHHCESCSLSRLGVPVLSTAALFKHEASLLVFTGNKTPVDLAVPGEDTTGGSQQLSRDAFAGNLSVIDELVATSLPLLVPDDSNSAGPLNT